MTGPVCDRCDDPAIMHAEYAGQHLCEAHFRESVERRVRRRIRKDDLYDGDAVTWLIGLSGGKDSAVLAAILADTFGDNPTVQISGLCIHEGIEGYRDESLEAARSLATQLDIDLEVRSYDDLYDLQIDTVAEDDPLDMAPCAYCGVFRRDALESYASEIDADLLLTGHNLDDEAQTALMNIFEGDLFQMAKHYDASLAPLPDRHPQDAFVHRAKPLREIPEREVALYALVRDLPAHMDTCPHAERSFRGEIQTLLHNLEEKHPGTRHSIMAGYEELAGLAATHRATKDTGGIDTCDECGSPTTGSICRTCELVEVVGGSR